MRAFAFFILIFSVLSGLPRLACSAGDGVELHDQLLAADRMNHGTAKGEDYPLAMAGVGYVSGVRDVLAALNILCLPSNFTAGQAVAIILKYLEDHPDQWQRPAVSIVSSALDKYTCKAKNQVPQG